jgi:hypothetical protein
MNKIHCVVVVLLMIMLLSSPAGAEQNELGAGGMDFCEKCHGLPPLENSNNSDKFFAGAHPVHKMIACGECHSAPSNSAHNNGMIDLRPDLHYDHGIEIPYPGGGGGSCGGDKNFPMLSGCHSDKIEMKCFWMPDNVCEPASAP